MAIIISGNRWSPTDTRQRATIRALLGSTALVAIALMPHRALAAPQGGTTAAGNVTIVNKPNGVTVNQTSNRAIVNWAPLRIQISDAL